MPYKYRRRYRRKTKYRMRRKMYRRRSYKPTWKQRTRPEVKSVTSFISLPTPMNSYMPIAGANQTLLGIQQHGVGLVTGFLQAINVGAGAGQRIGNRIFVRSIKFRFWFYICPEIESTEKYSSVSFRFIIFTGRSTSQTTNLPNFFRVPSFDRMINPIDRTQRNIYHDRVITLNAGYPIDGNSSTGEGNPRLHEFTLPFNRHVEYAQSTTGNGEVKNSRDFIQCAVVVQSPKVILDGVQLGCMYWNSTTYYEDD